MNRNRKILLGVLLPCFAACPGEAEQPPQDEAVASNDDSSPDEGGSESDDECVGPDGCWVCEAVEVEQVLNQCTEATCEPFANTSERLPLMQADGSLPLIP